MFGFGMPELFLVGLVIAATALVKRKSHPNQNSTSLAPDTKGEKQMKRGIMYNQPVRRDEPDWEKYSSFFEVDNPCMKTPFYGEYSW
jgi:hypothetical protein